MKDITYDNDYYQKAERAWEMAWDILHTLDDWTITAQSECGRGTVCSKKFSGIGKAYKLEALVDFKPSDLYEVLVPLVNDWPLWDPTVQYCKTVQVISDNTDISYSVGASALGGLVSSRDFVNLRHWKSRDGTMMSSACHVSHPDAPPCKQHVRAENKPACFAFRPHPEDPNKCYFTCILCMNLKGWLPQWVVDQALSTVLLEKLKHLQKHLDSRRSQKA